MEYGGSSLFSQILSVVDRDRFRVFVRETNSERCSKGFSSWDHFVSMLFCQIAQAKSLREIHGGLRSCEGKLVHLGMKQAPVEALFHMLMHIAARSCLRSFFMTYILLLAG